MGKYDYKNIIGSRGITVNVFKGDTEADIALRLIRHASDEYYDADYPANDLVVKSPEATDGQQ